MKIPFFSQRTAAAVVAGGTTGNIIASDGVTPSSAATVTSSTAGVRSASVVIAVTIQRLLDDPMRSWSTEEELVLDALRRSTGALKQASGPKIAAYLSGLEPQQLQGVVNNVKGIYHELLFVHLENTDGDEIMARIFGATNHPGADVEFLVDGGVIRHVQLKAVASHAAIIKHLGRYPDIDVVATEEVASRVSDVESSGLSNADLTEDVRDRLEDLSGDTILEEVLDGAVPSVLVAAAFAAGRAVRERRFSREHLQGALGDVAVGVVAATVLDLLIDGGT
jgi:hypothetical protein